MFACRYSERDASAHHLSTDEQVTFDPRNRHRRRIPGCRPGDPVRDRRDAAQGQDRLHGLPRSGSTAWPTPSTAGPSSACRRHDRARAPHPAAPASRRQLAGSASPQSVQRSEELLPGRCASADRSTLAGGAGIGSPAGLVAGSAEGPFADVRAGPTRSCTSVASAAPVAGHGAGCARPEPRHQRLRPAGGCLGILGVHQQGRRGQPHRLGLRLRV